MGSGGRPPAPLVGNGDLRDKTDDSIVKRPVGMTPLAPLWNSPFPSSGACGNCTHPSASPMACGPRARFRPGFSRFGIRSNGANAAFSGPAVATMYELGNMPRFQTHNGTWPNGSSSAVYGGLPQLVDMDDHLAAFEAIVNSMLPDKDFDGVVAMDWEVWYPTFDQLYDNMAVYAEESVKLVLSKQPALNATQAKAVAAAEFNAAAKALLLGTLRRGKSLRPRGRWGYYNYPRCMSYADCMGADGTNAASKGDTSCSPSYQRYNDVELDWLHSETTAFLPSLYLQSTVNASQNLVYTKCMTAEAMRVARKKAKPVFPFTWYSYDTAAPYGVYLSEQDAVAEWDTPARMGAAGLILYGGIGDCGNTTLCARLRDYVDGQLGPRVERLVRNADACSEANCSGNGRCVAEPTARCDCFDGFAGARCQQIRPRPRA